MKRVPAAVALSAGIIALSACTDTTAVDHVSAAGSGLTTSFSQDVTPDDAKEKKIAFMPMKNNIPDVQKEAGKSRPGSGTGISFHGGPVLQGGTKVVAIYWASTPIYLGGPATGTGPGSGDGSLVGYFLNHLGGSNYFGINTSYTDKNLVPIANTVTYTSFWANSNAPSGTTKVSDSQMIAMLQAGFDSHAIAYDPNTLYLIFTAGKVNLGGGFGTSYCGYHTHGTVTVNSAAVTALYAAMPYDYAYASSCTNGTAAPNGDPGADGEVSVLAHEIEETTTDMMGSAWYDNRGYENADKCAWNFGATYNNGTGIANVTIGSKDFLVQQNWQNAGSGGCVLHL
jgi:hypothetical protein